MKCVYPKQRTVGDEVRGWEVGPSTADLVGLCLALQSGVLQAGNTEGAEVLVV